MEINWELAQQLAGEWDIPALERAIDEQLMQMQAQQAAGGAMDMTGSAAYPQGASPQTGMGWGSVFGNAPAGPQVPPLAGAGMEMMQQPQTQAPNAPAAAPRQAPQMKFPGLPNINQVPTLGQLLKGGR